ncbi:hypothetical protein L1987_54142 [Smallanthus sonchifolius]|uniref:Uncharacterized protein n=1 Tax=Smallanthus sonchifolius TaxID=185202 RepID=A0ACB9E6P6_9ASTR|nr:hypothetical protein L1987_54142 [Smallanthus sonchifolius]
MKESVSRKDTGLETQQYEMHISAIHMDNVHGDGSTMSSNKKDDKILLSVRNTDDCFRFQASTIAAAAYLRMVGRRLILPSSNLSYSENFLYMLDSL